MGWKYEGVVDRLEVQRTHEVPRSGFEATKGRTTIAHDKPASEPRWIFLESGHLC